MARDIVRKPDMAVTDYPSVRPRLRTGDILFCSGSAFFSRMIQRVTSSEWSHVGLIVCLERPGRVMVAEAVESMGIRFIPLSLYLSSYRHDGRPYPGEIFVGRHSRFETAASEERLATVWQFVFDQIGRPYDRIECLRIIVAILRSRFGRLPTGARRRDNIYICSEFVEATLALIGLTFEGDTRGFIAPVDIALSPDVVISHRLL